LTDERAVYFGVEKELENEFIRRSHTSTCSSSDRNIMKAKTSELQGIVASDKGHRIYVYWLILIYLIWKMWWTLEQGRLEAK